jgi:hypothetical protein
MSHGVAVIALVALALPLSAAAVARAPSPPAAMFKSGYNLCKRASATAIGIAGGQEFQPGTFDGKVCTWSSSDGNYVVMLSTHPAAYAVTLSLLGKHGDKVSSVKVPGASKAVLDVFPFAKTHRYAKDLFAVYRRGVVQVSMNYKTPLATSKVIAVMRLVTRPS